jgi:hypothetical protein
MPVLLLASILMLYVPFTADELTVTFIETPQLVVHDDGLNETVTPDGIFDADQEIFLLLTGVLV